MNLNQLLDKVLLTIGEFNITVGNILLAVIILAILVFIYRIVSKRFLPRYFEREEIDPKERRKVYRLLQICLFLAALLSLVLSLGVDYVLYAMTIQGEGPDAPRTVEFRTSTLILAIFALALARFLDWVLSRIILHTYQKRRGNKSVQELRGQERGKTANRTVQYIVYVLAVLFIIQSFGVDYDFFPNAPDDPDGNGLHITISKLFTAILILLSARLGIWLMIQIVLYGYYTRNRINIGSQFAINQLLKYFVYVIASLIILETLGVKLTVLWGGAAALLVGIGLGLQQTFNDLISGIILLFERTVEVGDVVEIEGLIGIVRQIGLRTSQVETRENITVIVPNSKLIVDKVVNWSHYDNKARFVIGVGVAYGSDTDKVRKILVGIAKENGFVLKHPLPFVRFVDFGNSSLDFELHFWSQEFMRIEDVKSEMRFEIDRQFREQGVEIPFPQRDVWFKNQLPVSPKSETK